MQGWLILIDSKQACIVNFLVLKYVYLHQLIPPIKDDILILCILKPKVHLFFYFKRILKCLWVLKSVKKALCLLSLMDLLALSAGPRLLPALCSLSLAFKTQERSGHPFEQQHGIGAYHPPFPNILLAIVE